MYGAGSISVGLMIPWFGDLVFFMGTIMFLMSGLARRTSPSVFNSHDV